MLTHFETVENKKKPFGSNGSTAEGPADSKQAAADTSNSADILAHFSAWGG